MYRKFASEGDSGDFEGRDSESGTGTESSGCWSFASVEPEAGGGIGAGEEDERRR